MTNELLRGTVRLLGLESETMRVVALDTSLTVHAEAYANSEGDWEMSMAGQAETIIVQLKGPGIAARAFKPKELEGLALPELNVCVFEFLSPTDSDHFWIDPISLDNFPEMFLPALRTHIDGTIDLHIASYPARMGKLKLHLQTGQYRVSGGTLALRPPIEQSQHATQIAFVEDLPTGERLPSQNGTFILNVGSTRQLRVAFSRFGNEIP